MGIMNIYTGILIQAFRRGGAVNLLLHRFNGYLNQKYSASFLFLSIHLNNLYFTVLISK